MVAAGELVALLGERLMLATGPGVTVTDPVRLMAPTLARTVKLPTPVGAV